jgi:hypothetical protein
VKGSYNIGASVTNEWYDTGQIKRTTGSRTYPVEFSYDYAGRKQTMKTWQSYPSSGAAVTTWKYGVPSARVRNVAGGFG